MAKNKLLEEAIADVKIMREAAMATAKLALEEQMTPKLQSMISAKLMEADEDEELDEAKEDEVDEGLDKFLSELEDGMGDMQDKAPVDESYEEEELDENEEAEEEIGDDDDAAEEDADGDTDETGELEGEDVKISDLTVDEFKDIIRDVVQSELGAGGEHGGEMGGEEDFGGEELGGDHEGGGEDVDVNLDELLDGVDDLHESDDEEELDEGAEPITAKKRAINGITAKGGNANVGSTKSGLKPAPKVAVTKQLEEATKTIKYLVKEVKDVNLLNAKLIYVNKLFKENNNLNESQKLRIIESFDKATTTKEAKLVFTTLKESLKKAGSKIKSQLKENLNFASKVSGTTKPRNTEIVKDATVERFKKLANIK